MERDLKELLQEWRIPDPPPHLDARIAATYSGMLPRRVSVWRKPVRLPAPVFALLLVLQLASMTVIGHFLFSASPPAPVLSMPERVVEVPVVREKVVTQIVYLPAVPAGSSRQRASHGTATLENESLPMELTGYRPVAELQIRVLKGEQK
ncbi:MAG: hypothetical protein LAP85_29395 [Acidobacteriia bacterium]|nr:hypothetical protein [Terriglobia bacterium]